MKVTNYRAGFDPETYEQFVTVDLSISFELLELLGVLNKEYKDDLLMAVGQEMIEQIYKIRSEFCDAARRVDNV